MCRTQEFSLVERQTGLQRHHKEEPGDAWSSDSAEERSGNSQDPVWGEVELAGDSVTGRPCGIHRAVGGYHDAPDPDAPVGNQHLRRDLGLDAAADGQERTLRVLIDGAEQCCVIPDIA